MGRLCKYCHKGNDNTWCCTSHTSPHEGEYFGTTQYVPGIAGDFRNKCSQADVNGNMDSFSHYCSWFDQNPVGYDDKNNNLMDCDAKHNKENVDSKDRESSRRTADWDAIEEELLRRRVNQKCMVEVKGASSEKVDDKEEKIVKVVIDHAVDTVVDAVVPAPAAAITKDVIKAIIE